MPVKRSINLVLVNENKINPLKAILGILLIAALAVLFSKYLVIDRLAEVSAAEGRVSKLSDSLQDAREEMEAYGDIEESYAHYTYAGMTGAEMGLVDRTKIMALVGKIFENEVRPLTFEEFQVELNALLDMYKPENAPFDYDEFKRRFDWLVILCQPLEREEKRWNLVENLLTVEMTGESLEKLNELAREVEDNPIVDTCSIVTANKGKNKKVTRGVWGRFIVYLVQPAEEVAEP